MMELEFQISKLKMQAIHCREHPAILASELFDGVVLIQSTVSIIP